MSKHEKPEVVVTAEQYSGTPTSVPVKQQVEVLQPSGDVGVVNIKPGEVSFFDKLKAYYHTAITVLGALLVLLNEITPLTNSLGESAKHIVTVVILVLTAILNALKSNEVWVNKP